MNTAQQRKIGNLLRKSASFWKQDGDNVVFDDTQTGRAYQDKLVVLLENAGVLFKRDNADGYSRNRFPKGSRSVPTFDGEGRVTEV